MNDSIYFKMMKSLCESKKLNENFNLDDALADVTEAAESVYKGSEINSDTIDRILNDDKFEVSKKYTNEQKEQIVNWFKREEEIYLEESKKKLIKEDINLDKDETEIEESAEGTVTDVVAVVDPDLSSDDYEKVIDKAEEIIDETPDGEQPMDAQYIDQNIYTCPICGNAFFTEVELDEGDACPVCSEVPEAFIFNGKVAGELTNEDEATLDELEGNLDEEIPEDEESSEDMAPINDEDIGDEYEEQPSKEEKEDESKHESLDFHKACKLLNELRHIDRTVTAVAYDFSELSEEIQNNLIKNYRYNNRVKDDGDMSASNIIRNDARSSVIEELSKVPGIDVKELNKKTFSDLSYEDHDGRTAIRELEKYQNIPYRFKLSDLSSELDLNDDYKDNEYYKNRELNGEGVLNSDGYDRYIGDDILKSLRYYTNYSEISKAEKKEIRSKIQSMCQNIKTAFENGIKYYRDSFATNSDSISSLNKIKNKPIVRELSKDWYTEDGKVICSKDKAKVIKNESVEKILLTEAPVNIEYDNGSFDVYNYDELDDYGKRRAFDNKKHLANNLYGRRWPALKSQIEEDVNELVKSLGFKSANVDVTDEEVRVSTSTDDLVDYAKRNGIELIPNSEEKQKSYYSHPSVLIRYNMVGNTYSYNRGSFMVDVSGFESGGKEVQEELEMDFEGITAKIKRSIKNAHKQAEDDYKAKMSKQNKEYLKDGREYVEN